MPETGVMRLDYDEVDDAVLDPTTAHLDGDTLRVRGVVRGSGLLRDLAPGTSRRSRIPIELRIAPVTSWRFRDLERGTGELLAGEFRAHPAGGRVAGVIPGDLEVRSAGTPVAWFELGEEAQTGRPVVRPRADPVPPTPTPGHNWDWDWTSPLTVWFGRNRSLPVTFQEAWHFLLPALIAALVGTVVFFGGILASINPKRS